MAKLVERTNVEGNWELVGDVYITWGATTYCIHRQAKEILGLFRDGGCRIKEVL